ncbi:methyltransferase [Bartonella sp. TP]|uniref:methyltransferase n=1 Tax=Bartonella sp. TP TaxID=3057550 RepID=UPI0025B0FD2E|nr:methyltransferase [Bartonella sp. TP]MDN5248724.1 methyltransferase [Alphaproteobacteria bacterium]WJW79630.1 methyltransferase [Bartonella sp. TP]
MKQPLLFDHKQIELFRQRALRRAIPAPAFLLQIAAKDLSYRLSLVNRHFPFALDLHSYDNLAKEALLATGKVEQVTRIETDLSFLAASNEYIIAQREDLLKLPASVDLIVSLLSMQLINDLPNFLKMLLLKLKKDGLFLACFLGGKSLFELRSSLMEAELELHNGASARIAPFIALKDIGDLLHVAGFAMPVVDSEEVIVYYKNVNALIDDLRLWGMQNALQQRVKRPISKKLWARAQEIYTKNFSRSDGAVAATFEIIWVSAWAPHEEQQKPAKPGSAKISLATALSAKII